MAGIGIHLNRIFNKRSVTAYIYGVTYSVAYTIGPILMVIGCILLMYSALGFQQAGYMERELFSCSILYIFVFSLLTSSPFNSVLSKYMTDRIYLESFDDIRPAIYTGVIVNLSLSSLVAIPFYLRVYLVGKVPSYYVFTSYMGYLSLTLVFAVMIYNSILKHYKKMFKYFLWSMVFTFLISLLLRWVIGLSASYSMLLSLTLGFLLIAILEFANVLKYFTGNSYNYRGPLGYFIKYWQLVLSSFFYILGLFAHNFVFWTVPWNLVVAKSYVCNRPYDVASSLAMLTSVTATVIFIVNVERTFFERYSEYTTAVIGDRLDSIEITKKRMFRALVTQLMSLVQIQLIVSIIIFLIVSVILPFFGFGGVIMQIYPLLAVGFFISYVMYSGMLFLQYFNDLAGLFLTTLIFVVLSFGGSVVSSRFSFIWNGSGFTLAALISFTFVFFRLKWLEANFDNHIFCKGRIIKAGEGIKPPDLVYSKNKGELV